jgi:cytoskeleton protein RodZ
MDTFGARLKSEREDRGLTIQDVAETLGVDQNRLLALERNDFEALPGEAVMMACLRAYAECLDVDAELMIEDYAQERDKCLVRLAESVPDRAVEIAPAAVPSHGSRRQRFPVLPVVFLIVAVVVVAGSWWMFSGDGTASFPEQPAAATPASAAPVATESVDAGSSTPGALVPVTAVEPERTARRPEPAASPPTAMSINEYGVGTAIKKRRLVGESDRFVEGTQVWFWTRVEGGEAGDRIDHVWLEGGEVVARIPLKVGGSPWRTYSAKMLRAGSSDEWAVEARDGNDRVLARREFACAP